MPGLKHVLLTGGNGYIGSHVCVALQQLGYRVTLCDNLSNSDSTVPGNIKQISGEDPQFYQLDLLDQAALLNLFKSQHFDAVIHMAGLKSVAESVAHPERYHHVNVQGARNLVTAMRQSDTRGLIFSSSATVYGAARTLPIYESAKLAPINPYGSSKLQVEQELGQLHEREPRFAVTILRYFNPVGAHPSGLIGEQPRGVPNNLMPYLTQVAAGLRPQLQVYGNDYQTKDGTGVRDYIHVCDLAAGHVAALEHMMRRPSSARDRGQSMEIYNLGSGQGHSVLEVIATFERTTGIKLAWTFAPRRPGDLAACYADASRAAKVLNWRCTRDMADMCRDSWRWQQNLAALAPTTAHSAD